MVSGVQITYRMDLAATEESRVVQVLLGHVKLDGTIRYQGIEMDDALEISERRVIVADIIANAPCTSLSARANTGSYVELRTPKRTIRPRGAPPRV